jgi:hypothetical protein
MVDRAFSLAGEHSATPKSPRNPKPLPGLGLTKELAIMLAVRGGSEVGYAPPLAFMGADALEDFVVRCTGQIDEEALKWELAGEV